MSAAASCVHTYLVILFVDRGEGGKRNPPMFVRAAGCSVPAKLARAVLRRQDMVGGRAGRPAVPFLPREIRGPAGWWRSKQKVVRLFVAGSVLHMLSCSPVLSCPGLAPDGLAGPRVRSPPCTPLRCDGYEPTSSRNQRAATPLPRASPLRARAIDRPPRRATTRRGGESSVEASASTAPSIHRRTADGDLARPALCATHTQPRRGGTARVHRLCCIRLS